MIAWRCPVRKNCATGWKFEPGRPIENFTQLHGGSRLRNSVCGARLCASRSTSRRGGYDPVRAASDQRWELYGRDLHSAGGRAGKLLERRAVLLAGARLLRNARLGRLRGAGRKVRVARPEELALSPVARQGVRRQGGPRQKFFPGEEGEIRVSEG